MTTWPAEQWKIGGGTAGGFISYDPEADLIYYGTSNPGPWNSDQQQGDNKWTSTIFARRPDAGQACGHIKCHRTTLLITTRSTKWVIVDIQLNGQDRKVLLHPSRDGRLYVIDRVTGEVLSASPYAFTNTTISVDMKTGRPVENETKKPKFCHTVRDICPAAPGGKDWQPSAYSPRTHLLYLPHNNLCMEWSSIRPNYIAGTPYVGADVKYYAGPGGHRGEFTARDPVKSQGAWKTKERFPVWSGALVTAGDVVFYGTVDRKFRAVDATNGNILWETTTTSGIVGQPITYLGPDGKQYVAIFAGVGGWAGAIFAGQLDARDGTGAVGFVNAMADLPNYTARGGTLYVFSLP